MNQLSKEILILGIGNVLMGDEGVGVHAIRELETQTFPKNIHLLDGGTGGFHLLSYMQEYPYLIMIDATMDGKPPGTISVLQPRFAIDFPRALSSHDIGLRDLIESTAMLGDLPKMFLITVSIDEIQSMKIELSPLIKKSIPEILTAVRKILTLQKALPRKKLSLHKIS